MNHGRVLEVAIPSDTGGWVLVGQGQHAPERELLARTLPSLHAASLGTTTIDLPVGLRDAASCVRTAAASLRLDLAAGLPVAYLGAGAGAAPGWLASLDGELDGVIAVNGRPGHAWRSLRHVTVPSLLVAQTGGVPLPMFLARALSWQLDRSDLALLDGRSPLDGGAIASWYWERMLAPQAAISRRPMRRRIATIGIAAAVAVPALGGLAVQSAGAQTKKAGLPDFSRGSRLGAHQIAGDNARPGPAPAVRDKVREGRMLTAAEIQGDHHARPNQFATGSKVLTDASGVKHFINTDITFSTSSSGSAAMSEASYNHAVSASTLNGGHTASTLNDAYDGYQELCVSKNNAVSSCETGNANFILYNKLGAAPTSTCVGSVSNVDRELDFPTQTLPNSVTVTRQVFVPDNDAFGRWVNIVTNNGNSPQTITLAVANNLGSDNNTVITGDSSGNKTPTTSDTWVTTFQNFSGTTTSDPRLGHVLGGPGATTGLAGLFFQNGNDNPYWGYTLTVQPGQSQVVVNFGVTQPTIAASEAKSAALASLSDTHALDCMTPTEQAQVVNFAVPTTAGAQSFSTPHDTVLNEAAPGVLTGNSAASALTAEIVSGPSHASSFTLNSDGSFSYTPKAGFAGSDSFTYKTKGEGGGTSAPATVTLTVVGVVPAITSASSASFTVGKKSSFTVQTSGVPKPKLTVGSGLPKGLKFKDNGDGTATISGTAKPGTHGSHPITITASNGQGSSATQRLTVKVNAGPVPTATTHTYSTRGDRGLSVGAPGLLKGATGEKPLHAVLVSGSAHGGKVTLQSNGGFSYEAKSGFKGSDTFTYKAADLDGGSSPATTVHITVVLSFATQIEEIEQSLNQILTSYNMIVAATNSIVAQVHSQSVISQVQQQLAKAAALVKEARTLEHTALSQKPGGDALSAIAAGRKRAAQARADAAGARIIASNARANGQ